ncbi:GntR family transcriptional regulator [Kroppenstedtia eburnea]|uniref:Transcriptional regulator, GntR family n=1 Tax=Kroppenstedtia eburnea TaxID=714067 RepID=A0A1N7L9S2_9BACL|nr:GntR family transcriptional regulator [Kroppenstedtia eburnea]EGK07429.1 arabinose metabolism transcriptional repressor [Desmospora sp. 8437]QKI81457.1 GntR family transcriptional regulator [Kroppenstedtia eburnea]SIS70531.1 transcriptional regulator, GntR family [Kroppenstedtia eburnea]
MGTTRPKYQQLKNEIEKWIRSGKFQPGEKIPSELELAEQFGFSRQTVRLAISELVHEKWLYKVQGKGTFLTDTLPIKEGLDPQSHLIGVITTYISDYIFPSIIRGIESHLSPEGYSILLLNTDNDLEKEAAALKTVMDKQVDGLIIEPTQSAYPNPNLNLYFTLLEKQIPLVMLHSSYLELSVRSIRSNDRTGGYLAAKHLIDRGHSRLGGIFKADDLQGKYRFKGYLEAIQAHSLPFHPESVQFYTTEQRKQAAAQYVQLIVDSQIQPPTGIVCYNDEIAFDLVKELKQVNLQVPEDISIVSFDNSQLAEAGEVKLTTVHHPKFQMGVKAAECILQDIRQLRAGKKEILEDYVFEPELIIRSSTKPDRR